MYDTKIYFEISIAKRQVNCLLKNILEQLFLENIVSLFSYIVRIAEKLI